MTSYLCTWRINTLWSKAKVKLILSIFEHFFAYFVSRFRFIYHSFIKGVHMQRSFGSGLTGKTKRMLFAKVIFLSVEFDMSGLFGQTAQLPAWILLTYDPLSS